MHLMGGDRQANTWNQIKALAINDHCPLASFNEEDFVHIRVGMAGRNLAGRKAGSGKVGEVGKVALSQQHLLGDRGVMGNPLDRDFRERNSFQNQSSPRFSGGAGGSVATKSDGGRSSLQAHHTQPQ